MYLIKWPVSVYTIYLHSIVYLLKSVTELKYECDGNSGLNRSKVEQCIVRNQRFVCSRAMKVNKQVNVNASIYLAVTEHYSPFSNK